MLRHSGDMAVGSGAADPARPRPSPPTGKAGRTAERWQLWGGDGLHDATRQRTQNGGRTGISLVWVGEIVVISASASELLRAAHAGEPFDEETGLPLAELRERTDVSWYQHAREYIEMKWTHSPGSTRRTLAEAMATVTPVLVRDTKGMADARTVRTALYGWAFHVSRRDQEPPEEGWAGAGHRLWGGLGRGPVTGPDSRRVRLGVGQAPV